MSWTDEKRAEVVEMYEAAEPTAETSMEIVKGIAEDVEESPNGVRMILSKAGVYVTKAPAKKGETKSTRVSKADSQEALTDAIEAAGQEADQDIITKLTGKAAVYLTGLINAVNG